MANEFSNIDPDLKDLLDALVDQSIWCIRGLVQADMLLNDPMVSKKTKLQCFEDKQEFRIALNEVKAYFESTIGYH